MTNFIGARHPDFIHKKHPMYGKKENPTLEWYIQSAVNDSLANAGVPAEMVDRAWIGNFAGELFCQQGHLGAAVAGSNEGLINKPIMRVEGACASGGLAFSSAVESIKAGSDITLAIGAEVQTTTSARQGGEYLARASHFRRQSSIDDFVFPAMFARRIKACLEANIVDEFDLALLSLKAISNANLNPAAHMHHAILTLDDAKRASETNPNFLSNPSLKSYIKVSDCSQVSDGGAGVVLASEEGLKKIGKSPSDCIELVGIGQACGNLYTDSDPTEMSTTAAAAKMAFSSAGIDPSDIQLTEVHDCFNISEVLQLEALGFAKKGEGVKLLHNGELSLNGKLPTNTGGGLIGFGHPVGATGIKQVVEIFRQMNWLCGNYQVKRNVRFGLTSNMGGDDKTAVVCIFKNN